LQSARLRTAVVQGGALGGAARHPVRSAFGRMAPARRRWCTGPAAATGLCGRTHQAKRAVLQNLRSAVATSRRSLSLLWT